MATGRQPTKSEARDATVQDRPKPDKRAIEQYEAEQEAGQNTADPEREKQYAEQRKEAERIAKADNAPVDPNMLPPNTTASDLDR